MKNIGKERTEVKSNSEGVSNSHTGTSYGACTTIYNTLTNKTNEIFHDEFK